MRTCDYCGQEYEPRNKKQIYCCRKCANAASKKRKLGKWENPLPKDPVRECRQDCYYLAKHTCTKTCDFLLVEGVPRGCDPGKNCTRYKPGRREISLDWLLGRGKTL